MKYFYTLVLFFLVFKFTQAQQGFILAYDNNAPTLTFTNLLIDEHTLILTGLSVLDTFPYTSGITFSKIDTNGIVQSHNIYYDSLGDHYARLPLPSGFIKTSDESGYLILGNIFQRTTGFAMKVDNQGNQLWVREHTDNNSQQDIYRKIIETEDGFLIVGYKSMLNFDVNGFVLKMDKDGFVQWTKYYGENEKWEHFEEIIRLSNNEYVVGGYTTPVPTVPNEDWETSTIIMGIDSMGNELWSWESPLGLEEMDMDGLHKDEEGNWVYASGFGELHPSGAIARQASFIKRDSEFNLLEEKSYDDLDSDRNFFYNMISLANGDYLAVGTNGEFADSMQTEFHLYGWVARLATNGDSIWTRRLLLHPDSTQFTKNHLHSAVELPSGNIIVAGYFEAPFTPNLGLLLKIDCEGNIDTLVACEGFSTAIPHVVELEIGLKVFPNPVESVLHFESPVIPVWQKAEFLDMTGRVVKSITHNNQMTLGGIPSGMYVLRLWQGGEVWTRKVVIK